MTSSAVSAPPPEMSAIQAVGVNVMLANQSWRQGTEEAMTPAAP